MDELTGSTYLNVFISGVLEIPACFIAYFIMKYRGRKAGIQWLLLSGGALCLLSVPFDIISGTYHILLYIFHLI